MRSKTVCLLALALRTCATSTPIFDTSTASETGSVTGLDFKQRLYLPYDGSGIVAFGYGGAEQSAYDADEFMAYAVSEQNYVHVVDMMTFEIVTGWPIDGVATSAEVCGGKFFVAAGAEVVTDDGRVFIYETVKRGETQPPTMLSASMVGPLPDMIIPNRACTMLAVANEGESPGAAVEKRVASRRGAVVDGGSRPRRGVPRAYSEGESGGGVAERKQRDGAQARLSNRTTAR